MMRRIIATLLLPLGGINLTSVTAADPLAAADLDFCVGELIAETTCIFESYVGSPFYAVRFNCQVLEDPPGLLYPPQVVESYFNNAYPLGTAPHGSYSVKTKSVKEQPVTAGHAYCGKMINTLFRHYLNPNNNQAVPDQGEPCQEAPGGGGGGGGQTQ